VGRQGLWRGGGRGGGGRGRLRRGRGNLGFIFFPSFLWSRSELRELIIVRIQAIASAQRREGIRK